MICDICLKDISGVGANEYEGLELCDSCMVNINIELANPRMGNPDTQ